MQEALRLFCDSEGRPLQIAPPPPPLPSQGGERSECTCGALLALWPSHPPELLGPLCLVERPCGGARGLAASRAIRAGEVLLAERPILSWRSARPELERDLRALLSSAGRDDTIRALRQLHPTSLSELPPAELRKFEREYEGLLDDLLPLLAPPESAAESAEPAARATVLQLVLAVRFNGFASGLFLHQSLINHAAALDANCDKSAHTSLRADGGVVSVVRATRAIAEGEECTICYYQPPELSREAAAEQMRHFDFDVRCELQPPLSALRGEMQGRPGDGGAEPAAADQGRGWAEAVAQQSVAQQLRCRFCQGSVWDLEGQFGRQLAAACGAGGGLVQLTSRLELSLEPLQAACSPYHLALASAQRRVATVLRQRLSDADVGATSNKDWAAALVLLLRCSLHLWTVQIALLGHEHPECVHTLHDVASSIGGLLASEPRALQAHFPQWSSPVLASHAERRARELHAALAALHDVTPLR